VEFDTNPDGGILEYPASRGQRDIGVRHRVAMPDAGAARRDVASFACITLLRHPAIAKLEQVRIHLYERGRP
jgi:hypothetical protein